jgi:hypothetical protein
MRRLICSVALVGLLSVFLWGCGDKFDQKEDPTLAEIMEIGRGYLRAGDGGNASEAFQAAVKLSPTCDEAKFGLLISRNMQFFSLMDQLLSLVSQLAGQTAGEGAAPQENQIISAEVMPIGDYIQGFLRDSAVAWYDDAEELYLDLLTYRDPHFDIDRFHIGISGLIEMDFGGHLDRGDLHYFGMFNGLVRGIVSILLAHDLNIDFFSLEIPPIDLNLDFSDPQAIEDLLAALGPIVDLIEGLLTNEDNPDFLYLQGEEGVAMMQEAGVDLGLALERLHLSIEEVYRETGPQEDGAVHFVDVNGNGRGDRLSDPLVLPGFGELDAGVVNGLNVLASMTAQALWDTTPLDIDPYRPNPFYLAYANDLLVALDIFPLVIDAATLESLLAALGLDLQLGDDFEIIIPEILDGLLSIDIGPWFAQPAPDGIRQILWFIVDLYDTLKTLLPDLFGG